MSAMIAITYLFKEKDGRMKMTVASESKARTDEEETSAAVFQTVVEAVMEEIMLLNQSGVYLKQNGISKEAHKIARRILAKIADS